MEAHARIAVEMFCRYALRGPISIGRLSHGPRDLLTDRLKAPMPADATDPVNFRGRAHFTYPLDTLVGVLLMVIRNIEDPLPEFAPQPLGTKP